jgi:hypothetical protein
VWACLVAAKYAADRAFDVAEEARAQADLLRDLFGPPPFHAAAAPALLRWQGGLVPRLAEAVYRRRTSPLGTLDNEALTVPADALPEELGGAVELLDHLRSPGPHSVGCWAVDALTGRG